MIYTVTFNPALDYVLCVDSLCKEDIIRANHCALCAGGKGINVSVILSRLKTENQALGFLAGFSGRQLEAMLAGENIRTDFVYLQSGNTRINIKIKAEREIDINAHGPVITDTDMIRLFDKLENVKSGDYVVLAGSVPDSVEDNVYAQIMERLGKKHIRFVVDAEKDFLKNTLKYKPFLIKPNHYELGELFSTEIKTTDDAVFYAKQLQHMGARNVLVSMAEGGAIFIDKQGCVLSADNALGKMVSTVGCGDSMVAGFLAGYTEYGDFSKALELGTACANATAFSVNLAEKAEIDRILKSGEVKIHKRI